MERIKILLFGFIVGFGCNVFAQAGKLAPKDTCGSMKIVTVSGRQSPNLIPSANPALDTMQNTFSRNIHILAPPAPVAKLRQGGRYVPGDATPVTDVHPAYTLATLHSARFKPKVGGMDFLPDGRMVVTTWDSVGGVYILDGLQRGEPNLVVVKPIARGLAEPMGLKVVGKDIFVLQKHELTQLVDLNGDEITDEYRTVCSGWGLSINFNEFAFGLVYQGGYFYANLAQALTPDGRTVKNQNKDRGKTIKIARNGQFEIVASGLRTPNGIGIGTDNQLFMTDNPGDGAPAGKLLHYQKGANYGLPNTETAKTTQPAVWFPQGEVGNSPSQPVRILNGIYKDQMLVGDVAQGSIQRVYVELVNGQYQGCVFRFMSGLEAGVNRLAWGNDGALYIGELGLISTNPQATEISKNYGLQRIKYTGKPVFEMLNISAKSNGITLTFTEPLMQGYGTDTANYQVAQWRYDLLANEKKDLERMKIKSIHVSADRKTVFLEIPGLKKQNVVYVRLTGPILSENSRSLRATEGWYTLNQIPIKEDGPKGKFRATKNNYLSKAEKEAGWRLLFNGNNTKGWHNYNTATVSKLWDVEDDALVMAGKGAGDLVTDDEFEDFELEFDWKIAEGGNSGLLLKVIEAPENKQAWHTGLEIQLTDNEKQAEAAVPTQKAGGVSGLVMPSVDAVRPVGTYNRSRLVVEKGHVTHWLNGYKVADFTIGSREWEEAVRNSKFKKYSAFAKAKKGRIALPDQSEKAWYKNMRIRPLGVPTVNDKG